MVGSFKVIYHKVNKIFRGGDFCNKKLEKFCTFPKNDLKVFKVIKDFKDPKLDTSPFLTIRITGFATFFTDSAAGYSAIRIISLYLLA